MPKKVWQKPEVRKIVAGSAEGGSRNGTDLLGQGSGNPNRS